ncbi:hypothetical protein L6V77_29320 [Myxococcota bacterium]|nr:hypothetical protein [Myxococcota bacterium]
MTRSVGPAPRNRRSPSSTNRSVPGASGGLTPFALIAAAGLPAAWFALREPQAPPPPRPPEELTPSSTARPVRPVILIADASVSTGDVKARCADLTSELLRIAGRPDRVPLEVLLMATGDGRHTGGTPQVLHGWQRVERHPRPFVDPAVTEREYRAEVAALGAHCAERIATVRETRLFAAVRAAASDLEGRCAGLARDGMRCAEPIIFASTDGQETHQTEVAQAIAARVAGRPAPLSLTPVVVPRGTEVRLCGFSNSPRGGVLAGRVRDPDGVRSVWRELVPGALVEGACGQAAPVFSGPTRAGAHPPVAGEK